jgi:soluble lytic murein transglycosylase-like protein
MRRFLAIAVALAAVTTAAAPATIRVRRGDTLSELAQRYGTTVDALRELNDIEGSLIYAGQTLRLFATPAPTAAPAPRVRVYEIVHVVQQGDSLIRIARRYGADPDVVARRNRLPTSRVVRLGQRLLVEQRRVVAAPPPRADRAYVRSLIVREARAARVDPLLALAVAWQESGFQQHVTSHAGAIGVMQVMPGTGAWVARHLVGRPLDLRRVEHNVLAGVRYLALLVRGTGSAQLALAGYYQGLRSVRTRGMYDDTKRYVKNVLALRSRLAART